MYIVENLLKFGACVLVCVCARLRVCLQFTFRLTYLMMVESGPTNVACPCTRLVPSQCPHRRLAPPQPSLFSSFVSRLKMLTTFPHVVTILVREQGELDLTRPPIENTVPKLSSHQSQDVFGDPCHIF